MGWDTAERSVIGDDEIQVRVTHVQQTVVRHPAGAEHGRAFTCFQTEQRVSNPYCDLKICKIFQARVCAHIEGESQVMRVEEMDRKCDRFFCLEHTCLYT